MLAGEIMSIRNLHYLFSPRSVAVIGASDRDGSVGATCYRNILAGGFEGEIWAVNLRHSTVAGRAAVASVADLPGVPELAVICTPALAVPGLIAELGARGCRAAIVISAGLDARGPDGRPLRQAMLEAARPHLLRILGPNCVGLLAPSIGLNASFAPAAALPGRLAFVSQSGAMLTAVLDWANSRQIGFSSLVSLGDSSDVDVGDLLDYLAADPATDAILLYVESLKAARKFMSAGRSAARAKPTIVVKAGRSQKGAHAAFSHTGALAGADLVCDAALRRAGMLRVDSTEALFDAVAMLAHRRPLPGRRLAILTNGGGPAILAADAMEAAGGTLAELSAGTLAHLDQLLPASWSHGNPVDIVGDAPPQRYAEALQAVLDSGDADAVLLLHAPTAIAASADIARAIVPVLAGASRPVLSAWLGGNSVAEARQLCGATGQPVFDTPEAAVAGFLQLVQYSDNQQLLMQVPPAASNVALPGAAIRARLQEWLAQGRRELGMAECEEVLAAYGIPTVRGIVVVSDAEALAAAGRLGYPVALKARATGLSHKTDVGGVALDVRDEVGLLRAMADMRSRLARNGFQATGFTLQAMVQRPQACELLVGLSCDPVFGPVVLFGSGGIATEVLADRAIGLPPLNQVLAAELIGRTRAARLLQGFRHRPAADMAAINAVLVRIAQMAVDLPELAELDINPLLADSAGVLAVDARIRLQALPEAQAGQARLAILPYPQELVQNVAWQGGRICLRPVRPEDGAAHLAFFSRLSPEDIHFRVFSTLHELSPAQLARLTQIDYARDMAFIATRTGVDGSAETLGVARVASDPDNVRGEFAVVVRSDLKGQGLGHLLMACLLRYCREKGLTEVVGSALRDNARMLALARRLGFAEQKGEAGVLDLKLVLDRAAQAALPD